MESAKFLHQQTDSGQTPFCVKYKKPQFTPLLTPLVHCKGMVETGGEAVRLLTKVL